MKHTKILQRVSLLMASASLWMVGSSTAEAGQGPQPSICTRACWGARAPNCGITQMGGLSRAIVHHTAGSGDYSNNLENSKAVMRNVQNYHMSLSGWCDIAYHFLTDAAGNIFEGRSGAMSSLPRGTHDGCNANSFGFTALGYYHPPYNQVFTSASRNALEAVIAWRMPSAWSPYGSGTYCSRSVGFMDGHYRVSSTACPGDVIIPQLQGMRDGVNSRKNGGPAAGIAHPYIGVLYNDGLFAAKEGSYGGWLNLLGGVTAMQINGNRFGALGGDGAFYVKQGMYGAWTTQSGAGVGRFQLHGDRIAALYNNGILSCKDGLYGGWFDQLGGVTDFQLEGNRIAVVAGGTLYVKEGLQGGWTTQTSTGVVKFQLAGDRIAVLYSDGLFSCKDGLYGSWFNQLSGISTFHINGNRIAAIGGQVVYVKDGLQGAWTTQTGAGFSQVKLHGDRIAALGTDGTLLAKDGLYGSWYTQLGGVTQFQLDGDRIGVLAGGVVTVKYGLQGGWVNQTGANATTFQLETWTE